MVDIFKPGQGGRKSNAGRKKGVPNKVTGAAREMFQAFVDLRSGDIDRLWKQVADGHTVKVGNKKVFRAADPARALEVLGKLAEYVLPKLQRTEVTGANGVPLEPPKINITFGQGGPGMGGEPCVDEDEDEDEGESRP